jgi:hypothetical protein
VIIRFTIGRFSDSVFLATLGVRDLGAAMGILFYYGFALMAGVILGMLLALGIERGLYIAHQKSLKTRCIVWGYIIAGTGLLAVACQTIYQLQPMAPESMPAIGAAIFWMILLPASLLCAAIFGAIVLWPRVPPRVVSLTIIISSATLWGVSDVWSWIPLRLLLRVTLGIELFGREGLVEPNTPFEVHTAFAAGLFGVAALIVTLCRRRRGIIIGT